MEKNNEKNTENKTVKNPETETVTQAEVQVAQEERQRICLYSEDSSNYDEDQYRECCDLEPDEEIDNDSYWDWVNDAICAIWENFLYECHMHMPDNAVLVTGTSGLWNGVHEIIPTVVRGDEKECALVKAVYMCQVNGQSETEVWLEPDGTVSIDVTHHDGSNHKTVRMLTHKGLEIAEDIEGRGDESEYKLDQIEFEPFKPEHFWGKK